MTPTLSRDEREGLEEELHDVERDAGNIRDQARLLLKRQPASTDIRDVYLEKAAELIALADELEHASPFQAMRRRLEADKQASADRDARSQRIDYERSVLS